MTHQSKAIAVLQNGARFLPRRDPRKLNAHKSSIFLLYRRAHGPCLLPVWTTKKCHARGTLSVRAITDVLNSLPVLDGRDSPVGGALEVTSQIGKNTNRRCRLHPQMKLRRSFAFHVVRNLVILNHHHAWTGLKSYGITTLSNRK
jgi:hypothetical protein